MARNRHEIPVHVNQGHAVPDGGSRDQAVGGRGHDPAPSERNGQVEGRGPAAFVDREFGQWSEKRAEGLVIFARSNTRHEFQDHPIDQRGLTTDEERTKALLSRGIAVRAKNVDPNGGVNEVHGALGAGL